MDARPRHTLKVVLPLTVASIILIGFTYLAVQQDMRSSANDPQIQLAEDAATTLEAGAVPATVLPATNTVDVSKSLAPFMEVLNDSGTVVASSGTLNGAAPILPSGVLDKARTAEDRITWQPQSDVRLATVVVHYGGAQPGFVVTARSLREVEKRENQLTSIAAGTLIVILALTLLSLYL